MKISKITALTALAIGVLATSLQAGEITVPSGSILTIQQGVDAASPGDTVLVMPGTYTNPEIGQYWPPVVFVGADKPGLKLRAAGPPGSVKIIGPGLGRGILTYGDNVVVEGFDIAGLDVGILGGPARGARITGNSIHDCSSEGISLSGSTGSEIDHNTLEGGQHGIFLNGWAGAGPNTNHHLHDNLVTNAGAGIFLWQSPGCLIDHNETTGNHEFGIYLASSPNGTVGHNHANDNASVGILLGNSPGCLVAHNEANRNGAWGIAVGSSCGSRFEHNVAEGNRDYDLFAPNWESDPACNVYRENRGASAVPSPALWDVKPAPRRR